MTLAETINQTRKNIEKIKEYINNLEYNNNLNAETVAEGVKRPLDDISNALAFINDYNNITNDILKLLKDYYGDR